MDSTDETTLAVLDGYLKEPVPAGSVSLSDQYRRAIEQAEALPQNCSGVDKTWVEQSLREFRAHYARARRTP